MSMKKPFYLENPGDVFFLEEEKNELIKVGAQFLDRTECRMQENALTHFLNVPQVKRDVYSTFDSIAVPYPLNQNVLFPGSPSDFEEIPIENSDLEQFICKKVYSSFGRSFLMSGSRRIFGCIRLKEFSFDFLEYLVTGNEQTPFALLSEDLQKCLLWDFDLMYSILSCLGEYDFKLAPVDRNECGIEFFREIYQDIIPKKYLHNSLMECFIFPALRAD